MGVHERGGFEAARGIGLAVAGGIVGRTLGAATLRKIAGVAARGLIPRLAAPYLGRATAVGPATMARPARVLHTC